MNRLTRWNGKKWVLPQGMWREIADRLAAYEDTGLEPEQIAALQTEQGLDALMGGDRPNKYDLLTASIIVHDGAGNVPYVDSTNLNAYLYYDEIAANADNPEAAHGPGVNHLVVAVYRDHWHIVQVSGYTPDIGMFMKCYE